MEKVLKIALALTGVVVLARVVQKKILTESFFLENSARFLSYSKKFK